MTRHLPVAVYGTLRPGQGNAWLWERWGGHALFDGEATVPGFRLVSSRPTGGGFPYAIPSTPDDEIVVALIDCAHGAFDAMLAAMDGLEGYPHHYGRQIVAVTTPVLSPMRAWLYVPAWPCDVEDHAPIPGGDWVAAREAAR